MEKELLGLYLSDHPLDQFSEKLKNYVTHTVEECRSLNDKEDVVLAGVLTNVRSYYTKGKNEQMYFLTLEDKTGTISVTVFPRSAAELSAPPQKDSVVLVIGRASHRDRINRSGGGSGEEDAGASAASVEIVAEKLQPVADAEKLLGAAAAAQAGREERPLFSRLHILLDETMQAKLRPLQQSLSRYRQPGGSRLVLHIQDGPKTRRIQPSLTVAPDESMVSYLRSMLGRSGAVWTE
jgi:DNA polymerase-3 subunit alpha